MGWHAADRFAGMDHSAMKKLFFILLLALSVPASAASTNLAIAGYASGMYKSATAVAANGAFTMAPAISVAGRSVTVPATARFAANAGQFAVGAIRLNPTALVVGAVLPYLIGKGIEYANGKFELYEPSTASSTSLSAKVNFTWSQGLGGCSANLQSTTVSPRDYLLSSCASAGWNITSVSVGNTGFSTLPQTSSSYPIIAQGVVYYSGGSAVVSVRLDWVGSQANCPLGYTLQSGVCNLTNPQNLPVPESKWNEVIAEPLPDAVAQQLSRADVALPVEAPTFSPVDAPLGEPRLDPITGRMVQDRVRITQPNATSTLADVVPYTIDAGNVPQQTAAPEAATTKLETGEAPDSKTDCDKYPNSVACLDASDTPPNENLSTENRPFAVTPVSIGGAGTCRADFRIASSHGTFYIKTQPLCDAAGWLKPVILALAYLAAAKIISASVREG